MYKRQVQMLVRTVDDENATLPQRMDAAKTILDRVYGKASQPIEGNLSLIHI